MDPLGNGASQLDAPQTLNLYAYCGNDPVNHTDPEGLFFGALIGLFAAIFGAIGSAIAAVAGVVVKVLVTVAVYVINAIGTLLVNLLDKIPALKSFFIAAFSPESGTGVWEKLVFSAVVVGVGAVASHVNSEKKKKKKTVPSKTTPKYPPVIVVNPDGTKVIVDPSKPPVRTPEVRQPPPLNQERPLPPEGLGKPETMKMPKDATTRQKLKFWTAKALSGLRALKKIGDFFDGFGKWDIPIINPQALCEAAEAERMPPPFPWCPGPKT